MEEEVEVDVQRGRAEKIRKQLAALQKAREQEAKIRAVMAKMLDTAAYARLMNVRIANRELYVRAVNTVALMYRQVGRRVTENELVTILSTLSPRREVKIEVRRK